MNQILQWIAAHPTSSAVAAQYILSAAIGSLPMPNGSGNFYKWFFAFSNALAANINRARVGANGGKP